MFFLLVYDGLKCYMTILFRTFYSVCPRVFTRSSSEVSGALMAAIDAYEPDYSENIEKSLTNMNVVLSALTQQYEELSRSYLEFNTIFNKLHQFHHEELAHSYQEFKVNFKKQQQLLFEEMNLMRIEVSELRKALKKGD